MKHLPLLHHIVAYVTLGLLCGWYHVLLVVSVSMVALSAFYGPSNPLACCAALTPLMTLFVLTFLPLTHEPWPFFMNSWIFRVWCDYFSVTSDVSSVSLFPGDTDTNHNEGRGKLLIQGERYMFFEFPHGVFPMGQFLSASLIEEILPGHVICGTGADVIFKIPVMRHIMVTEWHMYMFTPLYDLLYYLH